MKWIAVLFAAAAGACAGAAALAIGLVIAENERRAQ
jgi:hypothetical protein